MHGQASQGSSDVSLSLVTAASHWGVFCHRLAWEEREFVELYQGKRQRVCVAANLVMGGALLWWLLGPYAGQPDWKAQYVHTVAAMVVAVLSLLLALVPSFQGPLSIAVRLSRQARLPLHPSLFSPGCGVVVSWRRHVRSSEVWAVSHVCLEVSHSPAWTLDFRDLMSVWLYEGCVLVHWV